MTFVFTATAAAWDTTLTKEPQSTIHFLRDSSMVLSKNLFGWFIFITLAFIWKSCQRMLIFPKFYQCCILPANKCHGMCKLALVVGCFVVDLSNEENMFQFLQKILDILWIFPKTKFVTQWAYVNVQHNIVEENKMKKSGFGQSQIIQ